jgi:hypothetical protein
MGRFNPAPETPGFTTPQLQRRQIQSTTILWDARQMKRLLIEDS